MRVGDLDFEPFIGKAEIEATVDRLAAELNRDYAGQRVVVCPVLTGAYMFAADLLRRLTVDVEVCFVKYTSYNGTQSSGVVNAEVPFPRSVDGRDVLIVEDVIDSGLSMGVMLKELEGLNPRSARVCALLYKPHAFKGSFHVDYVGREIGDDFIVGYGMDYNEQGRHLPEVYRKV